MFKVGDRVKLNGCPFDEQITEELLMYTWMKDKIQVVIDTMVPDEEGTSGQWIKTDYIGGWTDSFWFKKAEE